MDLFPHIIMSAMASQIAGVSIVYSTVCSGADHSVETHIWVHCLEEKNITEMISYILTLNNKYHTNTI